MRSLALNGLELASTILLLVWIFASAWAADKSTKKWGARWGWALGLTTLFVLGAITFPARTAIEEYGCRHYGYCADDREDAEPIDWM